jgi:hypothetical protein
MGDPAEEVVMTGRRRGKGGRRWQDLSEGQRRWIAVAGVLSTLLQGWMLVDLRRRSPQELRGSKRAWVALSFVRPFGQIAYVVWGRRPAAAAVQAPGDTPMDASLGA